MGELGNEKPQWRKDTTPLDRGAAFLNRIRLQKRRQKGQGEESAGTTPGEKDDTYAKIILNQNIEVKELNVRTWVILQIDLLFIGGGSA